MAEINQSFSLKYLKVWLTAFIIIVAILAMPSQINLVGVDILRMALGWLVVLFLPGYLLLPLVSKEAEPDFLETIPICFALSLAFLTIPLMTGFLLGLSFSLVTVLAVGSLAALTVVMFYLEYTGRLDSAMINWHVNAQMAAMALMVLAIFILVLWFGGSMAMVGDNKVHLGRIRRILEVPSLSPQAIEPFKNGGVHPGYAYPIWGMFQALISKLSGIDAVLVWYYLNPLLAVVSALAISLFVKLLFDNRRLATFAAALYLLPGAFVKAKEDILLNLRSLAHPGEFSMLIMAFIIGSFFLLFVKAKKFEIPVFMVFLLLVINQALVHVTNILYYLIPISGFLALKVLVDYKDRQSLIKISLAAAVTIVVGLAYFLAVRSYVGPFVADTLAGASRYIKEGRLLELRPGLFLPPPKTLLSSLPLLLLGGLLVPLAKRNTGLLFLLANLLAVLFVVINPWLYTGLAKAVSYTQMDRFLGQTWLNWLLNGVLIFFGLTYISLRSENFLEQNKPVQSVLILILPPLAYFAAWPYLTGSLTTLDNSIGLTLAVIVFASLLGLFLLTIRFEPAGYNSVLENILRGGPTIWVLAVFFVLYTFFFLPPEGYSTLAKGVQESKALVNDPVTIQGNNYMVSGDLVEFVKRNVPFDDVILSDPQTSEVLTAFVPRYVATYPAGHQSASEVGEGARKRMYRVANFFAPNATAESRTAIINRYDAKYVILNAYTITRFSGSPEVAKRIYADVKGLENLWLVFNDGRFAVFQVEQ